MLTLPASVRIFVYALPADMRCGFSRLSMYAQALMGQDPSSGHLFVFFNKYADKCKILFWDRTGYCIWYKQLQSGTFQRLDNASKTSNIEIDIKQLSMILEGIDLTKSKHRKRFKINQ